MLDPTDTPIRLSPLKGRYEHATSISRSSPDNLQGSPEPFTAEKDKQSPSRSRQEWFWSLLVSGSWALGEHPSTLQVQHPGHWNWFFGRSGRVFPHGAPQEDPHPAMKAIARQQRAPGLVEGLPKCLGPGCMGWWGSSEINRPGSFHEVDRIQ